MMCAKGGIGFTIDDIIYTRFVLLPLFWESGSPHLGDTQCMKLVNFVHNDY